VDPVVAELVLVAVPACSPRWRWSSWSRWFGGAGVLAVASVPSSAALAMLVVRGWRRWRGSTSTRWLDVAHDLLAERAGYSRIAAPRGPPP
jgi:hypothetical protein